MEFNLTPYFAKYEALVRKADAAFERVKKAYADCVKCEEKCADCCYALFDLTLIEALYIHHKFSENLKESAKLELIEKANRADRQIHRLKRYVFKDLQAGKSEEKILAELASARVRCPLLNEKQLCDLYANRPLTCRFYGIPSAIGGRGYTCGLSGFKTGEQYPTINLDSINSQLQQISAELLRDMKSNNVRLADLLVPLSMALITCYDDVYFGIADEEFDEVKQDKKNKRKKV